MCEHGKKLGSRTPLQPQSRFHHYSFIFKQYLLISIFLFFPPISHLFPPDKDARYPDAIAVSYDPGSRWLSCVYNDHSVYVWDVREVDAAVKVHAALFHAACVWDLEVNAWTLCFFFYLSF